MPPARSCVSLARYAMGTRFELVCAGVDPIRLRAAGEEALDEIDRLERQLSLYRPESDLSLFNRRAASEWVQLDPRFFRLLERALFLAAATEGAFDPTVTPLVQAWGFIGARGSLPDPADIEAARRVVGFQHVLLDRAAFAVHFDVEGVALDFGAIGKGYAVERALEILDEGGVEHAILHGGASTVGVRGDAEGQTGWLISIADPVERSRSVAAVRLRTGQALSVSALHEKCFTGPDGEIFGHVLDPRVGTPVQGARLAAVVAPSATDSDALSTALLVLGGEHSPGAADSGGGDGLLPAQLGELSTLVVDAHGSAQTSGPAFIRA